MTMHNPNPWRLARGLYSSIRILRPRMQPGPVIYIVFFSCFPFYFSLSDSRPGWGIRGVDGFSGSYYLAKFTLFLTRALLVCLGPVAFAVGSPFVLGTPYIGPMTEFPFLSVFAAISLSYVVWLTTKQTPRAQVWYSLKSTDRKGSRSQQGYRTFALRSIN